MATRKVLTVNHGETLLPSLEYRLIVLLEVFEILLSFAHTKDWGVAFLSVLPARKGAVVKTLEGDGLASSPSAESIPNESKSNAEDSCEE